MTYLPHASRINTTSLQEVPRELPDVHVLYTNSVQVRATTRGSSYQAGSQQGLVGPSRGENNSVPPPLTNEP